MIRGTNRVFIVFHNHQSVAEITKALEGGQQPVIVTLMETNTRFIEHVQNTGESSADLRGQTNALRFATREGHRWPIKAQVIQADIKEKPQAHADLAQHQITDLHLTIREQWFTGFKSPHTHQPLNALEGLTNTDSSEFRDPIGTDSNSEGFRPQRFPAQLGQGTSSRYFSSF